MKPILDPKRDLVLEMSTLLCKPQTLTAVVSNGRGIDGGVFGVGPGIPIRSMMDMTALVASDYGINPVTM